MERLNLPIWKDRSLRTSVGRGTGGLKVACAGGINSISRLSNVRSVLGYREQRLAFKVGPDGRSGSGDIIAQWCFPLRRQHAGRFDSGLEAKSSPIIGEIVTARSKTAMLRRNSAFYTHRERGGKSHLGRCRST